MEKGYRCGKRGGKGEEGKGEVVKREVERDGKGEKSKSGKRVKRSEKRCGLREKRGGEVGKTSK